MKDRSLTWNRRSLLRIKSVSFSFFLSPDLALQQGVFFYHVTNQLPFDSARRHYIGYLANIFLKLFLLVRCKGSTSDTSEGQLSTI